MAEQGLTIILIYDGDTPDHAILCENVGDARDIIGNRLAAGKRDFIALGRVERYDPAKHLETVQLSMDWREGATNG